MLAIDDSGSMLENKAGNMALEALTMMAKALTQLEVGEIAIMAFGKTSRLLHPFDKPFTDQCGMEVISQFTFCQEGTDMAGLMEQATQTLALSKYNADGANMQLLFIISDGRFGYAFADYDLSCSHQAYSLPFQHQISCARGKRLDKASSGTRDLLSVPDNRQSGQGLYS